MTESLYRDLEILRVARELISDEKNWIKGEFSDNNGCYCAVGAVYQAENLTTFWNDYALKYLNHYAANDVGFMGTASFNDDPSTTHADVLRMFDTVIARVEFDIKVNENGN